MIIPIIALQSPDISKDSLDHLQKLSILSDVTVRLTNSQNDEKSSLVFGNSTLGILQLLKSNLSIYHHVNMTGFNFMNDELVVQCLDGGLHIAFIEFPAIDGDIDIFTQVYKSLPRSRIGISFILPHIQESKVDSEDSLATALTSFCFEKLTAFNSISEHFHIQLPSNMTLVYDKWKDVLINVKQMISSLRHSVQIYFESESALSELEMASLATFHDQIHFYGQLKVDQGVPSPVSLDYIGVFIECLKTDRSDGLFTTVVCDEQGVCLGLVYSNKESIRIAVEEKRGVYWSRSRSNLWRKGDTSGMYQDLYSIDFDCDGDALRFIVRQRGDPASFCHLLTRTCWGESRGMQKLEEMLINRKIAAPPGSYTKRLFDDPGLLQMKLLEEVQELVEATDPDHIAAEAADVLYFLMTRCVAGGVGLSDIEAHLDKRSFKISRRPGNAKEWRNEKAKELLQTKGPAEDK